jgi:hypothetical protein
MGGEAFSAMQSLRCVFSPYYVDLQRSSYFSLPVCGFMENVEHGGLY